MFSRAGERDNQDTLTRSKMNISLLEVMSTSSPVRNQLDLVSELVLKSESQVDILIVAKGFICPICFMISRKAIDRPMTENNSRFYIVEISKSQRRCFNV